MGPRLIALSILMACTSPPPPEVPRCAPACAPGFACEQGVCVDTCRPPMLRCGYACVNPDTDVANCGGCEQVCAPAHSEAYCFSGTCSHDACEPGWSECDGIAKTGCETELPACEMELCGYFPDGGEKECSLWGWSATGETMLLWSPPELSLFDPRTQTSRPVPQIPLDAGVYWPLVLSGNGRWVAVNHSSRLTADDLDDEEDLFVVDLISGAVIRAPDFQGGSETLSDTSLAISHDGRFIVRVVRNSGVVFDRVTRSQLAIPGMAAASISGDGRTLGIQLPSATAPREQHLMDRLDDSVRVAIPRPYAQSGARTIGLGPPVLSHDARVIAVATRLSGFVPGENTSDVDRLVVANADGGIVFRIAPAMWPALSADGRRFVYGTDIDRNRGRPTRFHVMDLETRTDIFFTDERHPNAWGLSLSADGHRLVVHYSSTALNRLKLYVLP